MGRLDADLGLGVRLGHRRPQDRELSRQGQLRRPGQQADDDHGLFQRKAASLGIARALWFSYTDHDTTGPAFWTDRAGLFSLDGKPKPSWFAYAQAAGGTP